MPLDISCPTCKSSFRVSEKHAGKQGKCTKCGTRITIGNPDRRHVPSETHSTESTLATADKLDAYRTGQQANSSRSPGKLRSIWNWYREYRKTATPAFGEGESSKQKLNVEPKRSVAPITDFNQQVKLTPVKSGMAMLGCSTAVGGSCLMRTIVLIPIAFPLALIGIGLWLASFFIKTEQIKCPRCDELVRIEKAVNTIICPHCNIASKRSKEGWLEV